MTKTIPEIDDAKDFIRDAMDKARRKMDRDAWNAFVAEVTKPPTEPEIDDEMVERALEAYYGTEATIADPTDDMRAALTAALTPEIEVTETMAEAGWIASCEGYNSAIKRNAAVYRAMVKAAPGGIPHAINSVTIK
jgi:hypothetical protein